MKYITIYAVTLLFSLMLVGCDSTANAPQEYIEVSGQGEIEASADRFQIRASADARGKEASSLKADVDRKVDAAISQLTALGITQSDIRALSLNIQPEWQWQPTRELIGYQAKRELVVEIDSLATYTKALQALTDVGIANIRPGESRISNTEALANQALQLAVKNAQEKAQILAQSADRTLGKALVIQETGAHNRVPAPIMMMDTSAKPESVYSPGTSTITRNVSMRFQLD
jgi:uncharacterized protein